MNYLLSEKRLRHLVQVDKMPAALRDCVHEFGLPVVTALTKFGIRDPRHIREIVREMWAGARQEGQSTGTDGSLDWLLSHGMIRSSAGLRRFLSDNNMALVPVEPTRAMLDASMAEVSGFNVKCSREEKHRRRLRAALRAHMAKGQR